MAIGYTIDRLNRYVRKHGILESVWHLVKHVDITFIRNRYVILYCELTELRDELKKLPNHITFETKKAIEEISEEDFERLSLNAPQEVVKHSIEERFSRANTTLWLLKDAGKIATLHWSTTKMWGRDRFYPYSPRDMFYFDVYTFPEYRGKQYMSILMKYSLERIKEQGFRRVFLHIHELNKASLRGTPRGGMQKFGIARKFRLFGCDVVVWSDMTGGK